MTPSTPASHSTLSSPAVTLNGTAVNDHTLYVDGVSEAATGSANNVNTTSIYNLRLGSRDNAGTNAVSIEKIAWAGFWDRDLSIAELNSLYRENYQLLQPRTQFIDITVAAVGATGKSNPLHGPLGGPLYGAIA